MPTIAETTNYTSSLIFQKINKQNKNKIKDLLNCSQQLCRQKIKLQQKLKILFLHFLLGITVKKITEKKVFTFHGLWTMGKVGVWNQHLIILLLLLLLQKKTNQKENKFQ